MNDPRPAEVQSAYEILVASKQALLNQGQGDLWQSGRVESHQTLHVEYRGVRLVSGQKAWWKVRTYDSDGMPGDWSDPAGFEMGLLHESDWGGAWIAGALRGSAGRGVHAVCLRRDFLITQAVTSARIHIAVAGDFKLFVNAVPIAPAGSLASWTAFDDKVFYFSFDVTEQLLAEPNAVAVLLGDGYFAGDLPGIGRARYGARPYLRLCLTANLVDGTRIVINSDEQWRWAPSHLLAADINGGEHADANQLPSGWTEPGFDDALWQPVEKIMFEPQLKALPHALFGVTQALRPMTEPLVTTARGRSCALFDFGDQIVGRVHLSLTCRQSDHLLLTYCLDKSFSCTSEDSFTSAPDATDSYEGQFALHSFRYLKVEFTPHLTQVSHATALRIAAPESSAVSVRTDHATLNQLFEVIENSFKCAAATVPMHGVGPGERLPDFAAAGTWMPYFAGQDRSPALVLKWLEDAFAKLAPAPQGSPGTSPLIPAVKGADERLPYDEFAEFECVVATTWQHYRHHGDTQVLKHAYPPLRAIALSYRHANTHLLRSPSNTGLYGEGVTNPLVATCTLFDALRTLARMASVLALLSDHELLQALASDVRQAFRHRYITGDGHLACDTESACVAALHFGLLEDAEQQRAEQRLVELLQQQNYHSHAAPLVLPHLLPVLTAAERLDIAYMVLLQTSTPSWLAAVQAGDRLIAREPGRPEMASVGVLTWLLESLVGICLQDEYAPDMNAYRAVRVRPRPPLGKQFLAGAPVQFVEGSLRTPMGRYDVSWWIKEDRFELELLVPPGCQAQVIMPDDIEQTVQSGHHRFSMDFNAGGDGVPTLLELVGGRTA
ncbi:MAG: alpha-L-rhamnosidase N-terminal domain-containing protein [bacterium]